MKTRTLALAAIASLLALGPAAAFLTVLPGERQAGLQAAQEPLITAANVETLHVGASATVVEPHFIAWSVDEASVYIASPLGVWALAPGTQTLNQLATLSPREQLLDLSARGTLALLRDAETIAVRDAATGADVAVLALDGAVASARFTPDGARLAVVLDGGARLHLYDVATTGRIAEYAAGPGDGAYSVAFDAAAGSLVWFSATAAQRIDLETGAAGPVFRLGGSAIALATGPDGIVAVATSDGSVALWDAITGAAIVTVAGPAYSLAFSSDGSLLFAATEANVTIYDAISLSPLHTLPVQAFDAVPASSGRGLAIVGADGAIALWRAQ